MNQHGTASHLGGELEVDEAQVPHAGEVCPYSAEAFPDVLDYFKELRENAPVHRQSDGSFALSRYEDVYAALSDPATFSSNHVLAESPVAEANQRSIVYSDDPVHLELRQLVNRAWTPRSVIELRPKIERNVAWLLSNVVPGEAFDVLPIGQQLAFHTFADAMGVPFDEHERVRAWAVTASMFVRPKRAGAAASAASAQEQQKVFDAGFGDMEQYFTTLAATHRDHDPNRCKDEEGLPPFARAVVAAVKSDPDSMWEILHRILPPLHAGGTSTVAHIFPNVVDVLVSEPAVWDQLRADPTLLDPEGPSEAVEELLRLRAVVQGLPRLTTRDVSVHGTLIPAGSLVHLYYLSGSMDEEQFPDATEFKMRGISRHLGFGFGTHTCIGQSLVRLMVKTFVASLTERFTRLVRAPGELTWGTLGVYYTPDRMPVVAYA
jgi:cytochrome P450